MSETEAVDTPEFRGCIVCYSAEWALYAAKRAKRAAGTAAE